MNNFTGKKLLILAGAAVHCKIVEAARTMGVYTVVADYLENSPAKAIADEAWMLSITDTEEIVRRCSEEHIDGVLAYSIDPPQRPYQEICEKLNVPCFCSREQIRIMTDKVEFKKFCMANGLDVIPEYQAADFAEGNVAYPILFKPAISRGSRGQTICYSENEVPAAQAFAKRESPDGNMIVEKYMRGKQDFSLSYLVVDSKPYLLKIGDRYLGKEEDGLDKQCVTTISPSKFTAEYIKHIEPKVKKMIAALGISFGPVFLQGFIDGETVRFYDPGLRFPGGDFDLIIKAVTGFDPMSSMVAYALSGDPSYCVGNPEGTYLLDGKLGAQLTLSARPGKIRTYEGLTEVAALPYVVSVSQRAHPGDVIPRTGDARQRVTEITLLAPDGRHMAKTVNEIYARLRILDEEGASMTVSLPSLETFKSYPGADV